MGKSDQTIVLASRRTWRYVASDSGGLVKTGYKGGKVKRIDFRRVTDRLTYEEMMRYASMSMEELYALSDFEKARSFFAIRVMHPLRDEAEKKLLERLAWDSDEGIITLFGPTGSGKTSLARAVERQIAHSCGGDNPCIHIEVSAFGSARVSWHGFYESILVAGQEPMIEDKRSFSVQNGCLYASARRGSLKAFQDSVCSLLENRRIVLLTVDEILHILRYGQYDRAMDALKSLIDKVPCRLLLIGPYKLYGMVTSYGQVVRRGNIIYLGRYPPVDKDLSKKERKEHTGLNAYTRIIDKLSARWPLPTVPAFDRIVEELYDITLGVIGLLTSLLLECLVLQLRNDGEWAGGLFEKALEKKTKDSITKIEDEITAGETMLKQANFGECVLASSRLEDVKSRVGQIHDHRC